MSWVIIRNENKHKNTSKRVFELMPTSNQASAFTIMPLGSSCFPATKSNKGSKLLIANNSITTETRDMKILKYNKGFALNANLSR